MQRENKHEADMKNSGTVPARKKPKPCLSVACCQAGGRLGESLRATGAVPNAERGLQCTTIVPAR
jgi:hypothetical protein